MKKALAFALLLLLVAASTVIWAAAKNDERSAVLPDPSTKTRLFDVQSIDTMKESRDNARTYLAHLTADRADIDKQMALIASTGATHVAVDTPYDTEFLPVLRAWVASARAYHLSVIFRGNFSGWEGWFDYPHITRDEHLAMLTQFIENNPDLFQTGDVFTPCPECENGGPGDPRATGDAAGYNQFLIDEHTAAQAAFKAQGKSIMVLTSMNADIARDILTPGTIHQLGGTILIDHYVKTPEQFANDIATIPTRISGTVGLGEFGAPIPDLQGDLTPAQQAQYVNALFAALYKNSDQVPLVNYWTLSSGSTALVNDDGTPRPAYFVVRDYYSAQKITGTVTNTLGEPLHATVTIPELGFEAQVYGIFAAFIPLESSSTVEVYANGYGTTTLSTASSSVTLSLSPSHPSVWYRIRLFIRRWEKVIG